MSSTRATIADACSIVGRAGGADITRRRWKETSSDDAAGARGADIIEIAGEPS